MPGLIDQYIAKQFWGLFLAGLLVFVTLFVAVDATSLMVRFDLGLDVMGKYYLYSTPQVITQMLPVACLIGTIFTLAGMGRSNELTALFSAGMSLARVSLPILVSVAFLSGVNFILQDKVVPAFSKKKNFVWYNDIEKKPYLYSTVKTDKIWYRSRNVLFNLGTLNPEARLAQNVHFYYFDDSWNLFQQITAKTLEIQLDGAWTLRDGLVTLFVPESSFPLSQEFNEKKIRMDESIGDLQASAATSDTLGVKDLERFIKKNKEAGLDTVQYEVDYHSKYSFSFAAFVMAFLGIPFSIARTRSGGMALNLGLCLGLSFGYWAFYSSFLTIGKHGALPPILAAWTPNIAMVGLTTALLLRLKR